MWRAGHRRVGRPARAGRGCRRPSCWTPRPSRSRRASVASAIDTAGLAVAARRSTRRAVHAVQRRGEDLRHRRLAGPARADEQVGVVHPALLDRVAQRADDVLLADDVGERARAVAAVQRGGGRRHVQPSLREAPAELAQRAVHATLDRGQRLAEHLGDLRHGQLGAEAQRDRLALLGGELGRARAGAARDPRRRRAGVLGAVARARARARAPAPRRPRAARGRAAG